MTFQRPTTRLLTFYRSGPMPCPYLENRTEQQLFADLSGPAAQSTFESLSRAGFRRSHQVIYRPACRGCDACVPVRVAVRRFRMSRAWRRIVNANMELEVRDVGKTATEEQYTLFQRYVGARHGEGEMANMSWREFRAMVLTSPVETSMVEFREPGGTLIAACLIDHLSDGLSAVYSFFDPALKRRSLGSYVILWMIQQARLKHLEHVYLGYWIAGSPKMAYKARFRPLEGFRDGRWQVIDPDNSGS